MIEEEVMTREILETKITDLVKSALAAQICIIDIMVVLESNKFAVQIIAHEAARKAEVI